MADDLDYLMAPPTQAERSGMHQQEVNPNDLDDLTKPPPPAKMSDTGQTVEPMSGWQKGFQVMTDRLIMGGAQFNEAAAGLRLAAGSKLEDVEPDVEKLNLEELAKHRQDFVNENAYLNLFKLRDLPFADSWIPDENKNDVVNLTDIPGMLIESVPMMGVGAGLGWGSGAASAAIFGEAAVATVAGVALTPALIGGLGTATVLTGLAMGGSHIYQAMKRGVPKDQAVVGGVLSGAIGGFATSVGQGILGHSLGNATDIVLKSGGASKAIGALAKSYFGTIGLDVSANTVQTAVDATLKYYETKSTDKPMSLKELAFEIASGTAQGTVVAGAVGTGTHALGVAGAETALRNHTQAMERMRAHEQAEQARLAIAEQIEAQQEGIRALQTEANVERSQLRARKNLRGFIEVDVPAEVPTAQANYDQAVRVHEAHRTPQTLADVRHAKAELEHARYHEQLRAIEDALTSPDLMADTQAHITRLEGEIEVLKASRDAAPPTDRFAFDHSIKREQEQLRRVKLLRDLGSHEKVKARIEEMKQKFEGHVEETRKDVMLAEMEKRVADNTAEVEQLRAEIRQEKAQAKLDGTEANTDAKRSKLERLRGELELNQTILDMVKNDELGEKDIRKLSPTAPVARLKALAEIAKSKVEQAAKLGASEKAKEIKAAKKLLGTLIDHSRLPKEDKLVLKNKVAAIEASELAEMFDGLHAEIQEQFTKRRLEAARKDLKAQLQTIDDIDPAVRAKYPEVEEALKAIAEFAENPDAIETFLDGLENKGTSGDPVTEAEALKFELSELFPAPLKDLNAAQLERILDAIISLKEQGKTEALRRYQERIERLRRKTAIFDSRLGADRPRKEGIKATLNRILDDKVAAEIKTFRGLMVMASQFGEAHDMADIFDIKGAFSEMHKIRIFWERRLLHKLEQNGMTEKQWHKFQIEANKKGEVLTYDDVVLDEATGEQSVVARKLWRPNEEAHTLWELIQIRNYLLDEDPDAVSRFRNGNRYSYPGRVEPGRSTLEVVEDYLDHNASKQWRIAADTFREIYRPDEFGTVVNATIERRLGRALEENWTYGGRILGDSGDVIPRETLRRLRSNRPGSTHARQGGKEPVEIRSALLNLQSHITQYAREHAFFELEQDLPAVLGRKVFKDRMAKEIGDNMVPVLNQYVNDIVFGQKRMQTWLEKFWSYATETLHSQFLGGRVEQIYKQTTGAIHAMQKIGPGDAIEGWVTLLSDKRLLDQYLEDSGIAQARKQGRAPNVDAGKLGDLRRFNQFLGGYVKIGDEYGAFGAAFPVYLEALKRTGDRAYAAREADTVLDTTQSSMSIDEQPDLFRQHPAVRLMAFMAQEPTRQVEAIDTTVRQFKAGQVPFSKVMRIGFITYAGAFLYNMVGYAFRYPFLDNDERQKQFTYLMDISILGPYSGLAVVGQGLSALAVSTLRVVLNQNTRAYEPELLPGNYIADAIHLVDKTLKLKDGGDTAERWGWIMSAAQNIGNVSGLPIRGALKKVEPFVPGAKR